MGTHQKEVHVPEKYEGNKADKEGNEESKEKCGGDGEENRGCPFLSSDVDCIVTKAFNFSILLIELDQTGLQMYLFDLLSSLLILSVLLLFTYLLMTCNIQSWQRGL